MFYFKTQAKEWYGDDDFINGRYKNKFGSEYIVEGTYEEAIKFLSTKMIWNNHYREFLIGEPKIVSSWFLTKFEEDQIDLEGSIKYPATRVKIVSRLPEHTIVEGKNGIVIELVKI